MLKLPDQTFIFCPFCGQKTQAKIEEHHPVRFCPEHGKFYPHVAAAACAVILKGSNVLLLKRKHEPHKNTWMFPAGFINYGEHPKETVIREIKEETNLTVLSTKIFDILQSTDDPRSPGHFAFFYLTTIKDEKPIIDPSEVLDIGWFPLANLPEIGFLSHRQILTRLKNKNS